jgi:hypothetical protein
MKNGIFTTSVLVGERLMMATGTVVPGRDSPHVAYDSPRAWGHARRTTVHNMRLTDDEGFPVNFDRLPHHEQVEVEGQFLGRYCMERSLGRVKA